MSATELYSVLPEIGFGAIVALGLSVSVLWMRSVQSNAIAPKTKHDPSTKSSPDNGSNDVTHSEHGNWKATQGIEYLVLADDPVALELSPLEDPLQPIPEWNSELGKVGRLATPPSLVVERASVAISLIIPAYNECERLPHMLAEAITHLDARCPSVGPQGYEILIVDDGSSDATCATALQYWRTLCSSSRAPGPKSHLAVIRFAVNQGKGAAVRIGGLHARGELILFADADGATRFADLDRLMSYLFSLEQNSPITSPLQDWTPLFDSIPLAPAVVFGSRSHLVQTDAVVKVCNVKHTKLIYLTNGWMQKQNLC
jgi:hypothetical protein